MGLPAQCSVVVGSAESDIQSLMGDAAGCGRLPKSNTLSLPNGLLTKIRPTVSAPAVNRGAFSAAGPVHPAANTDLAYPI
jgi:hypothetical protein